MGEGGTDGGGGLDGGDIDGVRIRLRITPGAALDPRGVGRDAVNGFVCVLLGEEGTLRCCGGGGGGRAGGCFCRGCCLDADE